MAENTEYPTADHVEAGVPQADAEEETETEEAPAGEAEAPKDADDGGVPG